MNLEWKRQNWRDRYGEERGSGQRLILCDGVWPQIMELKNKCDAIEKREAEKRQLEEKKHNEEVQALKKTNQQLKVSSTHYH